MNRAKITSLYIDIDNLDELEALSEYTSLTHLKMRGMIFVSMSVLPRLPDSIQYLDCSYNQLTELTCLPESLIYLDCNNNLLTGLPRFPKLLTALNCSHNQLIILPSLSEVFVNLDCSINQLMELPILNELLQSLNCCNNPLPELYAEFPDIDFNYCDGDSLDRIREWQKPAYVLK